MSDTLLKDIPFGNGDEIPALLATAGIETLSQLKVASLETLRSIKVPGLGTKLDDLDLMELVMGLEDMGLLPEQQSEFVWATEVLERLDWKF